MQDKDINIQIAEVAIKIEYIKKAVDDLQETLKHGYVTKEEYHALEARVESLESSHTWAMRVAFGSLLSAVTTLAYVVLGV